MVSERQIVDRNRQPFDGYESELAALGYWGADLVFHHPASPVAVRRVAQMATAMHRHAFTELVLVTGGTGFHLVDDVRHRLQPGDFFIIGRRHSHAYVKPQHLEVIDVLIRTSFLTRHCGTLRKLHGGKRLFGSRFHRPHSLELGTLSACFRLIERLEHEATRQEEGFVAMQESILLELLVTLCRHDQRPTDAAKSMYSRIEKALSFMESRFNESLTVRELASRAGMSARSFLRHFRQETETTPMRYLQRLRVRHACNLLRTTDRTVEQIAADCGMGDAAAFCHLFRRLTGMTPSGFRKCGND